MNAIDFIARSADVLSERAEERGLEDERSVPCAVAMFNGLTSGSMSEREGNLFMVCLKLARAQQGTHDRPDDYVDAIGYTALAGEVGCAKAEGLRQTFDRMIAWNELPLGTKAHSSTGGWWYRMENGWKWNGPGGNGGVFPTPGANADRTVTLPVGKAEGSRIKADEMSGDGMYSRTESEEKFTGPAQPEWPRGLKLESSGRIDGMNFMLSVIGERKTYYSVERVMQIIKALSARRGIKDGSAQVDIHSDGDATVWVGEDSSVGAYIPADQIDQWVAMAKRVWRDEFERMKEVFKELDAVESVPTGGERLVEPRSGGGES